MATLLLLVSKTHETECSCDAALNAIAQLTDDDWAVIDPLAVHHLTLCRSCAEERKALLQASQAPAR